MEDVDRDTVEANLDPLSFSIQMATTAKTYLVLGIDALENGPRLNDTEDAMKYAVLRFKRAEALIAQAREHLEANGGNG